MKNKNSTMTILLLGLMTVALVLGLALMNQNQDVRRGAYFAGTKLLLQPTDVSGNVGGDVLVQLWVDSGLIPGTSEKAKVDFVQTRICYGANLSFDQTKIGELVSVNTDVFTGVQLAEVRDGCLDLAVASDKAVASLQGGMVRVATVKFTAVSMGTGTIRLIADKSQASGSNPNLTSKDMALTISEVNQSGYVVGGADQGTPVSFKMSFGGLLANAKCATNLAITMVAMSGQEKVAYENVTPVREGVENGRVIYRVDKTLTGFSGRNGVALFLKGSKHLQVKYGKDGQTAIYNQSGGELNLPSGVYDFSKYPILAGDITGMGGNQDGVVNGLDFSLVKDKVLKHSAVSEGQTLDADLDGDCMATNNDVQIIRASLQEKQGQLY